MEIFINSIGRSHKQVTLKYLEQEVLNDTSIVTTVNEFKAYRKAYGDNINVIRLPKNLTKAGLSKQRQFVYEELASHDTVCFLDDDIDFYVRKNKKLKKCKPKDFTKLLKLWEKWLMEPDIAIVGVSAKGGNNFIKSEYDECCRLMSAYMFNKKKLLHENIKFDRVKLRQDFDVVLCLLEKGYKNRVSYKYAHQQNGGSGAKGGCALYRTPELMKSEAEKLRLLHPKSVTVVEKKSKSGWNDMVENENGFKIRTDVRVQWKKAFVKQPANNILSYI